MAVKTKLEARGIIAAVTTRTGVTKTTGEVWERVQAVVIGPSTIAQVDVTDHPEKVKLSSGQSVAWLVEVGSFRDEDQVRFVSVLDVKAG